MRARRTSLKLIYESTDISEDIAPDLVGFDYTDNESGKADDINITLYNGDGKWSGDWLPTKGDTLKATIIDEQDQNAKQLYCGTFHIDEIESSGPPSQVKIKAVSVPIDSTIRRDKKTKAWEGSKLSEISTAIATEAGLELFFDADTDPSFDRVDQREESNLGFLSRLCEAEAFSLKVSDNKLIVFSQQKFEQSEPVFTIIKGTSSLISYNFKSQAFDLYKECTVSYLDPDTQELITHTELDPNVSKGQKAKIVKRANSFAEAIRWAKAELRKRNKQEVTASFDIVGSTGALSGLVFAASGFGKFDGNYIVEDARHSVNSGYTTNISARKTTELS